MNFKYGYFNDEGTEFIITDPKTPRAFDNFLWNDAVFSNVEQTGVGYCDYQVRDNEAVQLLTGNGKICDFDIFGRDSLMSRLVYVRDNDTGEYWTVNWEPVCKTFEKYECIHGLGYTNIKSTVNAISSEFRIFVAAENDPVELWTVKTLNRSGRARNLSIFAYVQFQFRYKWNFDSYGDMIFRGAWFCKSQNAVVACKHPHRKPHSYLTGFLTADRSIDAYEGTRDAFVGRYATLKGPEAVLRGRCMNTPGSSDATVGAIQFDLKLEPGQVNEISIILGATDHEDNIGLYRNKYFGNFEMYFNEMALQKRKLLEKTRVETPDRHFNRLMNYWIRQQTLYGATWCRWGWNGYRDIVQHGFGVSSFEPQRTREILLEAIKYQYESGLAIRGWNPTDDKVYSDSALWLVFTLIAYLKETGDMDLLNETVPYYDSGAASVLGHVEQALAFLEANRGRNGLCLIKFGDWNDSLTAVGKEGKGESIWLSEAYAEAMLLMAGLYEYLKEETKKTSCLEQYARIKDALNDAAWDGEWYTRCFDDEGKPVGSHKSKQGKIFIEAQAWALIAGIASPEHAAKVIASCDKLLLTELGYKLLDPAFTRPDDSIGRISCLEPGICENGTIYSHTNAWMILGLLKMHLADKAYGIFKRIAPGYVTGLESAKQNCPPYVFANCYYGPDHKNNPFQMEFTWITGSVAWYNNVMLCDFLGIKPDYRGLRIEPCIPSDWETYEVSKHFRGAVYSITVNNPDHIQFGSVEITVDGEMIDGNTVPIFMDKGTHIVNVLIKTDTGK